MNFAFCFPLSSLALRMQNDSRATVREGILNVRRLGIFFYVYLTCHFSQYADLHNLLSFYSPASVEPPWERAVALNKVPYYIK